MRKYLKEIRNYKFSDNKMMEKAKVFKEIYREDMKDFSRFDSDYNISVIEDISQKIQEIEAIPRAKQHRAILSQKTALVEKQMQKCRNIIQLSKFFIEKAFPSNKAKLLEFGFNNYTISNQSQPKMLLFLKVFHILLLKYKDVLFFKSPTSLGNELGRFKKFIYSRCTISKFNYFFRN